MLKCLECVFDKTFIHTTEILRTETERIFAKKVMKIPADEHPIEAVIVADENGAVFTYFFIDAIIKFEQPQWLPVTPTLSNRAK